MSDLRTHFPSRAEETLSTREGFGALAEFLKAFWIRDGRPDDALMKLLSWVSPVDDDQRPADPAMWADWLEAIDAHRARASTGS